MRAIRDLIILIAVFAGIWWLFVVIKPSSKMPELSLSEQQEEKLSTLIIDNIRLEYREVQDSATLAVVNLMSNHLVETLDSANYEFKFHVLDTEEVNAFATLDNHIFIFKGLIDFCENEKELAAVIAHEMGHLVHEHVGKKLIEEIGFSVLIAIVTNGDPNLITQVSKLLVTSKFSRAFESEADRFACELLIKSGIKPANLASFFLRLKINQESAFNDKMNFLMSHPSHEERIEDVMNYPLPHDFEEKNFEIIWQQEVT
ncbi:MAG: M48 family metallopeptidase [Cyclobacteriaceae bacterium]